jgi:hypothetical protein
MNLDALSLDIEGINQQVKASLAAAFTRHAYGSLAPGNQQPWDSDGFFRPRDAVELLELGYPIAWGELEFPVPSDCPSWSAPCAVGSTAIRGFLRHAWLSMPDGDSTDIVAIAAHSGASQISAGVDGHLLEPLSAYPRPPGTLLWRLGKASPRGVLHLYCDAHIVLSPELGRVSCMVGKPFWYR